MSTKPSEVASGFLSHLIELRDRLLRAVIVVAIAFVALFPFAKEIYNWLAAPLIEQGQEMIIIGPVAPFLVPMKLTLLVAFLIALPYLLYQLWSFVAPGLYKHEKRLVYPLLASSVFLFYLGILFVYYLLLPMMFKVIPQFAPDIATFSPDIAQYLDFTMMMFLAFGFGFEMPIATILLITTGMTTAEKLRQKRPYVIVGAFVVGMLLTPPDVISQIMLAIPMWILFELGIIASKFFKVRMKEASKAKDEMDKENTAATSTTAAIQADNLWDDDKYSYSESDEGDEGNEDDASENRTIHSSGSDYSDEDSFDTGSPDTESPEDEANNLIKKESLDGDLFDEEYLDEEGEGADKDADKEGDAKGKDKTEEKFFDDIDEESDFHEMDDEEMEAEFDRIEAEEEAEKIIKKKAKKRAKKKAKEKKKKKQDDKK